MSNSKLCTYIDINHTHRTTRKYDISRITETVLNKDWSKLPVTYDEVLLFDSMARDFAKEQLC